MVKRPTRLWLFPHVNYRREMEHWFPDRKKIEPIQGAGKMFYKNTGIRSLSVALCTTITAGALFIQTPCAHGQPLAKMTTSTVAAKFVADNARAELAGLVLSISGDWTVKSGIQSRTLRRGDSIPNGWTLSRLSNDGTIAIILTDGTKLKCPGNMANNSAISVKTQQSALKSWYSAAISMFAQRPTDWITAESRAMLFPGQKGLADAIVKAESGRIDLTPVFSPLRSGTYFIRLYEVDEDGGAIPRFGPEPVTVEKDRPIVLNPDRLEGGICKVVLSADWDDPTGVEAWVLPCDAKHYASDHVSFEKARSACEDLKQDAAPDTVRGLLRAYLSVLSASHYNQYQ